MSRTLGIVREGFSVWEGRSPLVPAAVKLLVSKASADCNDATLVSPSPHTSRHPRHPPHPSTAHSYPPPSPAARPPTPMLPPGQGARVLVQPSYRRAFSDEEWVRAPASMGAKAAVAHLPLQRAAGATVQEDLGTADVLLGVKQFGDATILPGKTHLMFAHVIKGQPQNMALLDTLMARGARLIDYECLTGGGVADV